MADELKDNFASNLQRLRKLRNISMIELADEIHVSQSTISDWENGKKMPRSGSIQKLADYFEVDKTDLLVSQNSSERAESKIEKSDVDLVDALKHVMSYDGKPMTDNDKEAILAFMRGRNSHE